MRCLAPFGRLVVFSHAGEAGNIGYSSGGYRKARPDSLVTSGRQVLEMLEMGQVQVLVGRTYLLEETAEAHRLVESRLSSGKVLIAVDSHTG